MSVISEISEQVKLPKVVKVRQHFNTKEIASVYDEVYKQVKACKGYDRIKPGMEIAVASGSRGLDRYDEATKAVVDAIKEKGATPFIFPAMGSHGGATAEGQKEMLFNMNKISEETMGCEIRSSMEVEKVGELKDGRGIFIDKNAWNADGIIIMNRIKPHTNIKGTYESGLMKMMAIGIGKRVGAESYHKTGYEDLERIIDEVGHAVVATDHIFMGIGMVDNGANRVCEVAVMEGKDIPELEPTYLKHAYDNIPRTFWNRCDVAIIQWVGKEIAGSGADPNVHGRTFLPQPSVDIKIRKMGFLNLSETSHGNCTGVGMADFVTEKLENRFSREASYVNAITNTVVKCVAMPMVLKNDREVFGIAIHTANLLDENEVKLSILKDTKHLDYIYITENMVEEAKAKGCDIVSEPQEIEFDKDGNLVIEF